MEKLLIITATNNYALNLLSKEQYIEILKEYKSSIDEQLKTIIKLSNGIDVDMLEG